MFTRHAGTGLVLVYQMCAYVGVTIVLIQRLLRHVLHACLQLLMGELLSHVLRQPVCGTGHTARHQLLPSIIRQRKPAGQDERCKEGVRACTEGVWG